MSELSFSQSMIESGAASSRCIASLIFSGNTTKFPETKWIFSHGGGVTPYVLEHPQRG